jgi:bacterioferritin-associated ferredoxin
LAQDVFLASIADKLIRLQLQIFARFVDWVDEVIVSARENRSVEPNALALLYGRLVAMDVSSALMGDASRVIDDPNVAGMVRDAYAESQARLFVSSKGILDVIVDGVATKCAECLGQIRGILAALRMTSRTPTAPAQYASVILRPLRAFLDSNIEITPDVRVVISEQVVSKAAAQFRAIVEETLATATRTEESLKKLRSRKEKTVQDKEEDETASGRVSKMMEMQLQLDIAEFARRARELVDDRREGGSVGDSIDQLRRVVRCDTAVE